MVLDNMLSDQSDELGQTVVTAFAARAGSMDSADPYASNAVMQRLMRHIHDSPSGKGLSLSRVQELMAVRSGAQLPDVVVQRMSAVLGHEFSGVRVLFSLPDAGHGHAVWLGSLDKGARRLQSARL